MNTLNNVLESDIRSISNYVSEFNDSLGKFRMEEELHNLDLSHNLQSLSNEIHQLRLELVSQNKKRNEILQNIEETLKAPNKTEAMENFGFAMRLVERGAIERSIEYFQKAIALNPLHYRSYIGISLAYIKMNNFEKALDYANESVLHAPDGEEYDFLGYSHQLISMIYYNMGKYQEALRSIKLAIRSTEKPGYLFDHARYEMKTRNLTDGIQLLKRSIERDPKLFALAAIEKDFLSYKDEVDNFLISLKEYLKDDVLKKFDSIKLLSIPDSKEILSLTDKGKYFSDFSNLVDEKREEIHQLLSKISKLLEKDTYESYRKADEYITSASRLINKFETLLGEQLAKIINDVEAKIESKSKQLNSNETNQERLKNEYKQINGEFWKTLFTNGNIWGLIISTIVSVFLFTVMPLFAGFVGVFVLVGIFTSIPVLSRALEEKSRNEERVKQYIRSNKVNSQTIAKEISELKNELPHIREDANKIKNKLIFVLNAQQAKV
ncbi:tetratricopeptide repeat protein [Neobacillus rhizophilus]|uniref:Tetratricopeptide repeat protein n=1 Tax=Neobacillus rhizophilus TaxID=2833579 RepID=A0A942U4M6_9BACI|nr:hypothetical protein [Neobacillus rhizophilus]MBS4212782.1 hypothetical protein [Neobacillus rhizophilus]